MRTPRWEPGQGRKKQLAQAAAPKETLPTPVNARSGDRARVTLDVVLAAQSGRLHARTVDLSYSGALFLLDDPMRPDLVSLSSVAMFCERHFHQGLTVLFGGGVVRRRMRVVRTSLGRVGKGVYPLVAACFSRELTVAECELLGLHSKQQDDLSIAICELDDEEP